jgi:hypothetical protein
MILTEENSLSTRALLLSYQQSSSSKQKEWAKEMMNLALQSTLLIPINFFTCCKILRHGAYGFTSPPKEGMLRISVTLKNPLTWLGFNLPTLGPIASTLTIIPVRQPISETYKISATLDTLVQKKYNF